ncbi:MEDS domain-containing protein [Egicoccus sp. AB-alg2]|uniref:MEDS domain-containing protein n=1 Tax=Egicoccus sp. AB-alg2 TaxID=3242693 RepID=UPI00359D92DC
MPSAHALAPQGRASHLVGFYESDDFLAEAVADFLAPALLADGIALVIATADHRARFAAAMHDRVAAAGLVVDPERLVLLDAQATLATLEVDGALDPDRFDTVVAGHIERLVATGRSVHIYGEMVALLHANERALEALVLEDLWNRQGLRHHFELLCGYPLHLFDGDGSAGTFQAVCERHTGVTNESYAGLLETRSARTGAVVLDRETRR